MQANTYGLGWWLGNYQGEYDAVGVEGFIWGKVFVSNRKCGMSLQLMPTLSAGFDIAYHPGGISGFVTILALYPAVQTGIFLSTNHIGNDLMWFVWQLLCA